MAKQHNSLFGNPTAIGLMGLAIGCGINVPISFGLITIDKPYPIIGIWVILAGVLHIYAGIVDLLNKNNLGATAFSVFSVIFFATGFQIIMGWSLPALFKPYLYVVFTLFTVFIFISFMSISFSLGLIGLVFLVTFVLETFSGFIPAMHHWVRYVIGSTYIVGFLIALWVIAGSLLNEIMGKDFFKQGKPLFKFSQHKEEPDDFASINHHLKVRKLIITALYKHWEQNGWDYLSTKDLDESIDIEYKDLVADSWYLYRKGYVEVDEEYLRKHPKKPKLVRLTANGIDYYARLQNQKFIF